MSFWIRFKEWLFGADLIPVRDLIDVITAADGDSNGYLSLSELMDYATKVRK